MSYTAYEIRRTKETATGTRYLVRCNRLGKWAICSWVGSEGNCMCFMCHIVYLKKKKLKWFAVYVVQTIRLSQHRSLYHTLYKCDCGNSYPYG